MITTSPQTVTTEWISTPRALSALVQSCSGLSNNPPSLYLSTNSHSLIIYVKPYHAINSINLSFFRAALQHKDESAAAFKSFLETGAVIKVFFDARTSSKILFNSCGIELTNGVCVERTYIHEVQMMELALRRKDTDHEWLAGLGKCIANDSSLDLNMLALSISNIHGEIDKRILHLPVLWEKYHSQLIDRRNGHGGSFWIAMIREATQKRLAVSRGEKHMGYGIDSARSAWDKDSIEEACESWNDDVLTDANTNGEWIGGAVHWAKFEIL